MINPTGKKLEKLLFGIFDDVTRGVDIYNHNGTMWLIFTDQMKWVVEYTKDQTLWYNYYLFEQEMGFVGLNCLDHQEIIRKWFESRFLKQLELVKFIQNPILPKEFEVEDVIQNGVKDGTPMGEIKYVRPHWSLEESSIEEVIQNGVKETKPLPSQDGNMNWGNYYHGKEDRSKSFNDYMSDAIRFGVKGTYNDSSDNIARVEGIIRVGEKINKDRI